MERTPNRVLADWMTGQKLSSNELSELVNGAIAGFTGRWGTTNEQTVHRWRSGTHTWPNEKQRIALQRVTGRTPVQLGFRPKGDHPHPPAPEEDPVYRRAFLVAATAAGASVAAPSATEQRRLGAGDVDRLNAKLSAVVSMDDRYGGTPELEDHAAGLATETIDVQQRHAASARVRSELYAVAAAFSTSAMWAAVDGRRLSQAERHLDRAVTLAGLASDPAIEFRVWGHASILYRQLGRHTDALAASERSRSTCARRRDPLYTSLAMARMAVQHADLRDERSALRTLRVAHDAFERVDSAKRRPPWMNFFDRAELDSLATFAHLRLGRWADAERYGHQCLARLRPNLRRNRALTHANIALAQLGQGELEQAVATAKTVPAQMADHGRIKMLLGDFSASLKEVAPRSAPARDWTEHRKAFAA